MKKTLMMILLAAFQVSCSVKDTAAAADAGTPATADAGAKATDAGSSDAAQ